MSQLCRQGYPVLPGLVVDSTCYASAVMAACNCDPSLAELWRQSEAGSIGEDCSLQQQAIMARQAMEAASVAEQATAVAVALSKALMAWPTTTLVLRPSFSFPGAERQPLLNLLAARPARRDRLEEIAAGVQQLWSEIFTGQGLFYWRKLGVPVASLRLAILVQPLLTTEIAGQVHANSERWEIETIAGLGQSL
ncbi:MAG: hypothetical protein AAFY11_03495, partial [Cyanobacteria bacterium J06641_5]